MCANGRFCETSEASQGVARGSRWAVWDDATLKEEPKGVRGVDVDQ